MEPGQRVRPPSLSFSWVDVFERFMYVFKRERKRSRIFHSLVHSSNSCRGQGRATGKHVIWVSRMGAGARVIRLSPAAFFLKIYFIFIEKADLQRGRETNRSSIRWFSPQVAATAIAEPI